MHIWVDADACPVVIKEILYRAAIRTKTQIIFVANQLLRTPPSPFIKKIHVAAGFDVADNRIVNDLQIGDMVITADIPLADAVITKGGVVLNPRGTFYNKHNIKQHLTMRDFREELRSGGVGGGGPAKLTSREIQAFANCLDQMLQKK